MKTKNEQLRPLLDEVLPDMEGQGGPNCAEVIGMVRAERAKRGQRRAMAAAVVVVLGVVAFSFVQQEQESSKVVEVAVVSPVKVKPEVAAPSLPPVKRINDEELLELLADTPSALLEWPNGERTLLIVEHR